MRRFTSFFLIVLLMAYACRTAQTATTKAEGENPPPAPAFKLGWKDVSFYFSPREALPLATTVSAEGSIFPKAIFLELIKLADSEKASSTDKRQYQSYEDWVVAALRVDTCAKLLPVTPCETQVRLILQPLEKFGAFRDQTIHLAYTIEESGRLAMLQDFVNLRRGQGDLGTLARKYARLSTLKRVAVMLTINRVWTFSASEVVAGKLAPLPLPCVGAPRVDFVSSEIAIRRELPLKIDPASQCADLHANRLLTEDITGGQWSKLSADEKEKDLQMALRINDPERTFFASTDCVSCHVSGRALYRVKGERYLKADTADSNRYVIPEDMQDQGDFPAADHINAWGVRAFGYGQDGKSKAMSLYTFHDSLRVAHEINELMRAGKLK